MPGTLPPDENCSGSSGPVSPSSVRSLYPNIVPPAMSAAVLGFLLMNAKSFGMITFVSLKSHLPAVKTSLLMNLPKELPKSKKDPSRRGQLSFRNLPIAFNFSLFSLSLHQSVNFLRTLPTKVIKKNFKILSNTLFTGASAFCTVPTRPLKIPDSNLSSAAPLLAVSLSLLVFAAIFFLNFSSACSVARIELTDFSISPRIS